METTQSGAPSPSPESASPRACDAPLVDWDALDLPPAWPDEIDLRKPHHLYRLIRRVLSKPSRVHLPADLPGRDRIPRYAQLEFHRLPNGFYSHRITRGYARWFDATMLYTPRRARHAIAELVRGRRSVLDLGCADGKLAEAFVQAGVPDVVALDVSPYLLKLGASQRPAVQFFHGAAESMPFRNERFDAIGAFFLFHELPPRHAREALRECHRILRPRGRLVISEPSPEQLERGALLKNLRLGGLSAPYFQLLARVVYEPYVRLWHGADHAAWFSSGGFRLLEDRREYPCRTFVAEKVAS